MATKKNKSTNVSPQVREYLAANGRKGGEATRELVQAGKEALGRSGEKKRR